MNPESKRTILIASIGTSSGVLTNVVGALAHQKKPVVSDENVVASITKSDRS